MNKDLSNYNWITSDGKTIRPVNPHPKLLAHYNTWDKFEYNYTNPDWGLFEAEVKDLHFACEGLQFNKVYKWCELQEVWQSYNSEANIWEDSYCQRHNTSLVYASYEKKMFPFECRQIYRLKEQAKEETPVKESVEQAAGKFKAGDIVEIKDNMVMVNYSTKGRIVHISKAEPIYGLRFDMSTTIIYFHSNMIKAVTPGVA